ncbi:DNA polymerase subunit Cdc27 [Popillia japonica]|uniref:DNA polymerase delta subunit 3 n=1 Tax=Popillia japonica TaxID=7064 RepID=A0AAW1K4K2_POPJA
MDEDDYLQKITELVYDDNEIVTPTKLSRILKIKIQDAQSLLDKYVKNADIPGQNDLSWSYTVIETKIDNSLSVSIIKGDELDKGKDVFSKHTFSVQRHGNIDRVMLANVEPFIESKVRNEPLLGSVVIVNEAKDANNTVENKQNTTNTSLNKSKKNGIEGFCTKTVTNSNTPVKPVINGKAKQKNMMANFFSKSNSANNSETLNKITEEKPLINDNDNSDDMKMDLDNEVPSQDGNISTNVDAIEVKSSEVTINKEVKKSKKRKSDNKSGQASKKRKRIVETADSDSDIFASSESEVEVVPDIHYSDENYEEQTKPQPSAPVKVRRMKQITEEFMDEDGYMNTIQKYVVVSDDEDEENKQQNAVDVVTEKPPVKNNDSSLATTKKEIKQQNAVDVVTEKPPVKNNDSSLATTKKEISPKKSVKSSKGKAAKTVQNQPSIMSFFKKTWKSVKSSKGKAAKTVQNQPSIMSFFKKT